MDGDVCDREAVFDDAVCVGAMDGEVYDDVE